MQRLNPSTRTANLFGALGLLLAATACSEEPAATPSGARAVAGARSPGGAQPTSPAASPGAPAVAAQRNVVVNGTPISVAQLAAIESHYRLQIADGRYWYDRTSGAAGPAGGPTLAFIVPGLDLGGPLAADASAGTTGVFVNGRELPPYDLIALTRLVGFVQPGRYFLDAMGNAGFEGGPPMVNLVASSRQLQTQGAGDGWYSQSIQAGGNESGGAGYVMGKDASGNTWSASY